jgi:2-methylcitrate dehydratase PrpD
MSALERLGSYVAASGRERRCEAMRELVELHLIDTVGALIASMRTLEGVGLLRFRATMRARGQGAWPLDLATRCALARLSEIDDIHLPSMTTPGAIVIPGALTLAGALPAIAAEDVIAAILAGTEAMTRLGRAIDGPAILYRGVWPTYFTAPFGMAAAAARLLDLDEEATAHALALALTLAAPAVGHHNAATTARWFAVGNAARNGLNAALAAQQGFTADRKLLEADVLGITPAVAALTDGLDERTALTEVSFKPWCAARQTMAATQALKDVIAGGVAPAAIDAIVVSVPPPHLKMIDHGVVAGDRASHLTSVQYAMAAAALATEMAFDVQQAPPDLPPPVRALMGKIKVEADERLLAAYPVSWPARVRVAAGPTRHARDVTHVPGDPAFPFDRARVQEKFLRFTQPALGAETSEGILARCGSVLATGEFSQLMDEIERACPTTSPSPSGEAAGSGS